jgi:hypothetical protein
MTISDDLKSAETRVGVFLTAHHIVLYIALAIALMTGVYLVESKLASIADAKAEAAQTALAVAKDEAAKREALYQAAEAQRKTERDAFLATIALIQSQVKVQIIHDKALPAPELGHRIETITGFKQGTITLNSTDELIVPLPLATDIVVRLDQGQADAQTVVKQEGVIKNQAATIVDQTGIIAEDKVVLTKQIKADADVLSAEKARSRKSKLKWFGAGAVFGFVGRQFVHFGL